MGVFFCMLRIPVPWLAALIISTAVVTVYFYLQVVQYALPAVFPDGETIQMASWDFAFAYASAWPIRVEANVTLDRIVWAPYGLVAGMPKIPDGISVYSYDAYRVRFLITNRSGTIWSCWYNPDALGTGAYLCSQNRVVKIADYFYVYIPIPETYVDVDAYNYLVDLIAQTAATVGVAFDKPVYNLYGNAVMYNATTIGIRAYQGDGVVVTIPIRSQIAYSTSSVTFYPITDIGSFYDIPREINYKIYRRAIYIVAFRPPFGYAGTVEVRLSGGPGP
jgi:hypothetical protein